MNSNILLSEFEWYIRDYFFRINNKNVEEFKEIFEINEIGSCLHKNYLRYRTWRLDEVYNMVNKIIPHLQDKNVLTTIADNAKVKLHSKLDRKQCSKCFYINYLSINEMVQCHRCMSKDLKEFNPIKKK